VAQKLNHQQARWLLYLSCFDFTLHHKPGQSMGKLDVLSRLADHGSGQKDNNNLTLLAPELFWIQALAATRLEGDEQNTLQEVQCSQRTEVSYHQAGPQYAHRWTCRPLQDPTAYILQLLVALDVPLHQHLCDLCSHNINNLLASSTLWRHLRHHGT
jgi:hypothetical protein